MPFLVYWGLAEPGEDPFLAGARWAASAGLGELFGDLIGDLLGQVEGLQIYDPSLQRWKDLA